MNYAVIDIGSNSVRLMMTDGKTTVKTINTTRLADGLAHTNRLSADRIIATATAVKNFVEQGKSQNMQIYVFATEAVRSAENSSDFIKILNDADISVDIIAGDLEARLGFWGAYEGDQIAATVDVGGASTEIAVGDNNGIIYAKSVPVGVVKIKNTCGEDIKKIDNYIDAQIKKYGNIPPVKKLLAIGGTAGTVAAILKKCVVYEPEKIHGSIITRNQLTQVAQQIISTSPTERRLIVGLPQSRADVTAGGALLLAKVLERLNLESLIVSEKDNLEGYLKIKQSASLRHF